MKKHNLVIFLSFFLCLCSNAQRVEALFRDKNYGKLVQFEKDSDKLSPRELYMLGYAFFQLENDAKAVAFYDKAIAKGLDSAYVHCDKGVALRYSKYYGEAIKEFDIAIKKAPVNQMYRSEKGFAYYYAGDLPKAFDVFLEAQKLPNSVQAPFYMVPHIYQQNGEFDKALEGFYKALKHISKDNEYYVSTLADIGELQFAFAKNYSRSAEAYALGIRINPKNYDLYPGLIKAWNAEKHYARADSVFNLIKRAYDHKELPAEDMRYKNILVDEDNWQGRKLSVYRSLADSKDSGDACYKVYVLNKEGDGVERTFMVEKAGQVPGAPMHLLREKGITAGTCFTYPQGWETDRIPLDELKRSVVLVLDGKMKVSASSEDKEN